MTPIVSRATALVAALTLALVVAACGGSSSPQPSASSSGAPSSAAPSEPASASASPSETSAGSEAPSASFGSGPDAQGAAEALANVKKYQLDLKASGIVPVASGASAVTISILVDQDADATKMTIGGFAALPIGGNGLTVITIGQDAWIDPTGTGTFLKQPGGAGTYGALAQQYSPASVLKLVPAAALSGLPLVGHESKNGVQTSHYHADAASVPALSESLGATGVSDMWIADDGGYIVSASSSGTTTVNGVDTPIESSIDVSRINDPTISITAPS